MTTLRPGPAGDGREGLVPVLGTPASVPLGPLEAFVLSKVDGVRTVEELAILVNLTTVEALHVLDRLVDLVPGLSLVAPGSAKEELLDGLWDDDPSEVPTTQMQLTPEQLRELEENHGD